MNFEIPDELRHPSIYALLILLGSFLLAGCVRFFLSRTMKRIASQTKTKIDDHFIDSLQSPVTVSIVLGGIWQAFQFISFNPSLRHLIFGLLVTMVVISWMLAALNFSGDLVDWLSEGENPRRLIQPKTKPLFLIVFKVLVVTFAAYFIILAWGQNLTAWLASAGVAGIAIGLASKDSLANFISGIFIIADSPFKIGDYIVLDNGDRGRVTHIGIRSTRLLTNDDVEVIIPNAVMGNSTIINQSGGPYEKFRLRVPVSVAYGSDIDEVRQVLLECAKVEDKVEQVPAPRVRFRQMGESSLDWEIWVWVREPAIMEEVKDIMLSRAYKALNRAEIGIPFPQMDLHIKEWPEGSSRNPARD
ncbi:Mechanosensitive ion channel family protein [Sulfidibacter corallicola]|uniref:Mechanosensitive ion channel family protein n=1 Tax=Sulfidibacter corallicola TaxID=2818388 RepID=A0A8A4TEY2_SULCO|nr:mechanosensitive ion channel family protein [Sulfidibacter corallicola]QTD47774.1 mechanosensitive ion channel family protein [Sulfidibacter corallicola]